MTHTIILIALGSAVSLFVTLWLLERDKRLHLTKKRDELGRMTHDALDECAKWRDQCERATKRAVAAEMREASLWKTLTEVRRRQAARRKP